jgi:hypothetical protein
MRTLLVLAVCSPLVLGGAAVARADTGSGGPLSPSGAPAAQVTDFGCVRALAPTARMITVTGVMRPASGTQRMRMRFDLLVSPRRRGRYRTVHGPNLGLWLAPDDRSLGSRPGDVWQVPHPVYDLAAPAFYKFRVSFRWLDAGGRVRARQVLVTAICRQVELRPDLAAQSLSISASTVPGDDAYAALVGNLGLTGAGPFDVQLTLADGTTPTRQILWLGAHRSRQVKFVAAACTAGSKVMVSVDPADAVDDFDRANNTLTVVCPGG